MKYLKFLVALPIAAMLIACEATSPVTSTAVETPADATTAEAERTIMAASGYSTPLGECYGGWDDYPNGWKIVEGDIVACQYVAPTKPHVELTATPTRVTENQEVTITLQVTDLKNAIAMDSIYIADSHRRSDDAISYWFVHDDGKNCANGQVSETGWWYNQYKEETSPEGQCVAGTITAIMYSIPAVNALSWRENSSLRTVRFFVEDPKYEGFTTSGSVTVRVNRKR
jgi:hypothetical protein